MAQPKNAKIEKLAEEFVDLRDNYLAHKQPMIDKRHLLETAMKEAKLTYYEYDGKEVRIEGEEKATVRKKKKVKIDA
jgi:hypothetical protein